ncbi:MAG TPA: histidine kinase dimerization/phosphoacceptor domain-containing protein, partial [Chitinophagaceae bacterium]|nr:histidine kinase dimerization/phosphoacceptor domain-containing protein [Chitinophagaceae bacterium]
KKRLQNQKEVLDERLRISRELHDEVGATLSGVALFSEIAKQKMEADHTANGIIEWFIKR